MPSVYQIRPAKPHHLPLFRLMERRLFPKDAAADFYGAKWWIVWHGSQAVGFGGVRLLPRAAFLCLAGVLPRHRGLGLHARLIRVRERYAFQKRKRIITYTERSNLSSANSLIKRGYRLFRWRGADCVRWMHFIKRRAS